MRFPYRHRRTGPVIVDLEGFSEDDYTTLLISRTRTFYEHEVLRYIDWISSISRLDDLFVDVGGHIGNHAVYFGSFLASHVVCVEANPAVIPTLERNLATNLASYTLVHCAAGERGGTVTVSYPEENVGMARVRSARGAADEGPTVEVRTLDSILAAAMAPLGAGRRVSVLKVDVEGMEADVLRGALGTLHEHRPHLFLEAMEEEDRQRLDAVLLPLGYRAIAHLGHTPVYHYVHRPSSRLRARASAYLALHHLRRRLSRVSGLWAGLRGRSG